MKGEKKGHRRGSIVLSASYAPRDDLICLYLGQSAGPGESHHMVDDDQSAGTIMLGFDGEGRVTTIEIIGASKAIPDDLLVKLKSMKEDME